MINATHGKEVSLRVINDVGVLAQLTKIVAEKGINILAAATWCEDKGSGVIHLVTDDNLRAVDALRARNYDPKEERSIAVKVSHQPGMLSSIYQRIGAENIGIRYLYGSATINDDQCLLILATDNDDKALIALNK